MKIVDFSSRELNKIPELQLPSQVTNTEARLYLYNDKNKWDKKKNILKIFYDNRSFDFKPYINEELLQSDLNRNVFHEDRFTYTKPYIIAELLLHKDEINIDELVLPTGFVSIDKKVSGYIMPFIESSINMSLLLNNPNVALKEKLELLKKIYEILSKIEKVKSLEGNFYLGDIHESNFIIDVLEQKVKVVDMDSCYINDSAVPVSRFLFNNFNLDYLQHKYKMTEDDRVIPSHNAHVLCFLYMLLNSLSGEKSYKWGIEEHYLYLNCLEKMGMNKEVIEVFNTMYDSSPKLDFDINLLNAIDSTKNYSLQYRK
ncbi:MAG: hypothetical protein IJ743_01270 [Bacilli bacterium]|nr:hypothetical protein [Bacilli bacterium]MBR1817469.1 hypothetical protein [Bacilli bacterium]